jgi:hypothetical protein
MEQFDLFGNIIVKDSENVYISKSKQIDLSSEISVDYVLEIICKSETDQENMYNKLTKEGYKCRVLTL